jgi:hypothetical protein
VVSTPQKSGQAIGNPMITGRNAGKPIYPNSQRFGNMCSVFDSGNQAPHDVPNVYLPAFPTPSSKRAEFAAYFISDKVLFL